jgi:hypothetical protein
MEKEFVTYELALRMKALGFDEPCFGYFTSPKELIIQQPKDKNGVYVYFAPTYSQAFRWFREKYDLPSWTYESEGKWFWKIVKGDFWEQDQKPYTFEEAELACLTKLIEIVESK